MANGFVNEMSNVNEPESEGGRREVWGKSCDRSFQAEVVAFLRLQSNYPGCFYIGCPPGCSGRSRFDEAVQSFCSFLFLEIPLIIFILEGETVAIGDVTDREAVDACIEWVISKFYHYACFQQIWRNIIKKKGACICISLSYTFVQEMHTGERKKRNESMFSRFSKDHRLLVEPSCGAALSLIYSARSHASLKFIVTSTSFTTFAICLKHRHRHLFDGLESVNSCTATTCM